MLAEDTDLTFQVYLAGYKIRYVGDAECYEEAVVSWKSYWRQRHRWAKGHMQVCLKHAFSVLKNKRMNKKQKIDGLLVLFIYFLPVVTLFSLVIGTFLIFNKSSLAVLLWFIIPISVYSFVGNYAPFFEIGVGAYLDGRKRIQWLMPFLIFLFFYNILICTKAFFDLLVGRFIGDKNLWSKTDHYGQKIESANLALEKL
jgi:cellulose synthase/poly-beta-1,6-N-acetylglucosamine synthase-like glycosyltransferase